MNHWEMEVRQPGGLQPLIDVLHAAGFSQEDYDDLENRINPYASMTSSHPLDIWILLGYVAQGAFSMERFPAYPHHRAADRIRLFPKKRESDYHCYLKKLATVWLRREKKIKKILYEQWYQGGISDVSSKDCMWVVECGCCRVEKIWKTFYSEAAADQKIVLFNSEGITIFGAGRKVSEYIALESEYRAKCFQRCHLAMEGFGSGEKK